MLIITNVLYKIWIRISSDTMKFHNFHHCTSILSIELMIIDVNNSSWLWWTHLLYISIKRSWIQACFIQSLAWYESEMKLLIFSLSALLLVQFCSGTGVISALRQAILEGYEKDAKPDGKVTVKVGMDITDFSLCAHKEVNVCLNTYSMVSIIRQCLLIFHGFEFEIVLYV